MASTVRSSGVPAPRCHAAGAGRCQTLPRSISTSPRQGSGGRCPVALLLRCTSRGTGERNLLAPGRDGTESLPENERLFPLIPAGSGQVKDLLIPTHPGSNPAHSPSLRGSSSHPASPSQRRTLAGMINVMLMRPLQVSLSAPAG